MVYRQNEPAAGDASLEFQHDPPAAQVVPVEIGRQRPIEFEQNFADVVLADPIATGRGNLAGIDGAIDGQNLAASFRRADTDREVRAGLQRLAV